MPAPAPNPLARARAREHVRGLYGIADADASGGDPVGLGAALIAGGCRLVQLRCKGWRADEVLRAARALRPLATGAGALLVINDHPEIVTAADADGLHLGQTDGPLADARKLCGDRFIGRSTNAPEQVAAALAEGADYLAFGPMYPTSNLSRPKEVRGVVALGRVRAEVPPDVALVAIGGITLPRLPEVRAAGADAWAVIGAIASAADPVAATRAWIDAG